MRKEKKKRRKKRKELSILERANKVIGSFSNNEDVRQFSFFDKGIIIVSAIFKDDDQANVLFYLINANGQNQMEDFLHTESLTIPDHHTVYFDIEIKQKEKIIFGEIILRDGNEILDRREFKEAVA